MIVPDTNVWSELLRRRAQHASPIAARLAHMIAAGTPVFLIGIIYQEVLQGLRSLEQRASVAESLVRFPMLQPRRSTYEQAARLVDRCARRGFAIGTIDGLIAATTIERGFELLTLDADFEHIASVSPALRLA